MGVYGIRGKEREPGRLEREARAVLGVGGTRGWEARAALSCKQDFLAWGNGTPSGTFCITGLERLI